MKRISKKTIVCLITVSSLLLFAASIASAVPMYFNDRATFDIATGGGLDLESFETAWTTGPTISFSGFTLSETDGLNLVAQATSPSPFITGGEGAAWYHDNGDSITTFFNFTNPINAFGLDVTTSFGSELGDTDITIGGDASDVLTLAYKTSQFWGVIDSDGLSSISFDGSGELWLGFDELSYGVASVPEPSTLLLLGGGLLGLAGFRRKFKV